LRVEAFDRALGDRKAICRVAAIDSRPGVNVDPPHLGDGLVAAIAVAGSFTPR
jgi:hypothetical protein